MNLTITFCRDTVKTLHQHLQAAFRAGDLHGIKRITALLLLADQRPVSALPTRLGVGRSTVYIWLHALLVDRVASLQRRTPSGRPAKLTSTQKQRLGALLRPVPRRPAIAPAVGTVP